MTLPLQNPAAPTPEPLDATRAHARAKWDQALRRPLNLEGQGGGIPEAWFLGPQGENVDLLKELIGAAIDSHVGFRRAFHPEDPTHITPELRQSPEFQQGVERLRHETGRLLEKLQMSAPFASMRYQGHMLWDQALPATIGLFAALLYNQNNVAAEASPVTTRLEIEAGNDLCRMLGYDVPGENEVIAPDRIIPWGHITSGGTVANIEALWAARNLKFAAVGLRAALRAVPALTPARMLEVPLWGGGTGRLVELDTWTLLNLDLDVVAGLPATVAALGVSPEALTQALVPYALQNTGMVSFYRNFMPDVPEAPVFLTPATGHYSWPKAGDAVGPRSERAPGAAGGPRRAAGSRAGRDHAVASSMRRRIPLLMAVAVIGSTEESAVDPLEGLLALRTQFQALGLNFVVHADAAWGGYFRAMLRDEGEPDSRKQIPTQAMSAYVQAQYAALGQADSITVDPHKGGYIPYPAGALCYRNAAVRDAISLRSPVVFHSQAEPTVGVYGVEGSKPGSSAAAVWLAHRVIRPDRSGYGRILGQCIWTSKRFYARLRTMEDERFTVTLFNQTPAERSHAGADALATERTMLRRFVALDNAGLSHLLDTDPAASALFSELGSDQVILAFALNFRTKDGVNPSISKANAFNERVFSLCSMIEPRADFTGLDLLLTSSRFSPSVYGHRFVDGFGARMGLARSPDAGIDFLISTTMDPWTTETTGGDFLAVLEDALRRAAHLALDELGM